MIEQAQAKIAAEMEANKTNEYIQYVGTFLSLHIARSKKAAEKILAEDKTIAKSLEAMKKVAEKKKVGNMAMLTPQHGCIVVLEYFGIIGEAAAPAVPVVEINEDFNVNLDDLLSEV